MKIISIAVISFTFIAGIALAYLQFLMSQFITIESWESKTVDGTPVYNKIRYIRSNKKDIWMMNQSHKGLHSTQWDRLAIIVNAGKVSFYQLPSGDLDWDDQLKNQAIENSVSCYLCHSNGPRVIRPEPNSLKQMPLKNKLALYAMNMRIKAYGQLQESDYHKVTDRNLKTPFRYQGKKDNEVLQVQSCARCHNETSLFGRGNLTRQNIVTIDFMLKNKLMPPRGFQISNDDQKKITEFINGF